MSLHKWQVVKATVSIIISAKAQDRQTPRERRKTDGPMETQRDGGKEKTTQDYRLGLATPYTFQSVTQRWIPNIVLDI